VATDQNAVLVGAPNVDGAMGQVYLFTPLGSDWYAEVLGADPAGLGNAQLGSTVGMSGRLFAAGAPGALAFAGSAYVLEGAPLAVTNAPQLALHLSATTVRHTAQGVTGTVTLTNPAPSGGLVVTLKSSIPAFASVPDTVTVAAGKRTASFKINARRAVAARTVTITGKALGDSNSVMIAVIP
jgi:hypothetical protein